ncbi:hypothetical protein EVA_12995, partial [gut metagenome]
FVQVSSERSPALSLDIQLTFKIQYEQ